MNYIKWKIDKKVFKIFFFLDPVKCPEDDDSVSCGMCGARYPLAQLSAFIQHKSQGCSGQPLSPPPQPTVRLSGGSADNNNGRVISPDSFTERQAAEDLRKKSGKFKIN